MVNRIDAELARVMSESVVYSAGRSRNNDLDRLEAQIKETLQDFYDHTPQVVLEDLQEAARCLAFELPVGSTMVASHGVELMLKHYYDLVGARPARGTDDRTTFKQLTGQLRSWKRSEGLSKPSDSFIALLDNLAILRNNVIHSANRSDISDARTHFDQCITGVRYILLDLKEYGLLEGLRGGFNQESILEDMIVFPTPIGHRQITVD